MSGSPETSLPMSGRLEDYTISLGGYAWGQLLSPWSPPLPEKYEILIISRFSDAFVIAPDGGVLWVNAQHARVDRVAKNRVEFSNLMREQHVGFLKTPVVDGLVREGVVLGPGQVYGLRTPATDGGKFERGNIGVASITDAFAWLGQLYLVKTGAAVPSFTPQPRNLQ